MANLLSTTDTDVQKVELVVSPVLWSSDPKTHPITAQVSTPEWHAMDSSSLLLSLILSSSDGRIARQIRRAKCWRIVRRSGTPFKRATRIIASLPIGPALSRSPYEILRYTVESKDFFWSISNVLRLPWSNQCWSEFIRMRVHTKRYYSGLLNGW